MSTLVANVLKTQTSGYSNVVRRSLRSSESRIKCPNGFFRGVTGRIGIYEVLKMNSELRQLVAKGAITEDIHCLALSEGMLDLKKYSALMLLQGETSVEEVLQVVSVQE